MPFAPADEGTKVAPVIKKMAIEMANRYMRYFKFSIPRYYKIGLLAFACNIFKVVPAKGNVKSQVVI